MIHFRQGDVFIEQGPIPSDANPMMGPRIILAAGEVTGHHHVIVAEPTVCQAYEKDGKIYLHVKSPVYLMHEEHKSIMLPVGKYVSHIQREYDPIESRRVAD